MFLVIANTTVTWDQNLTGAHEHRFKSNHSWVGWYTGGGSLGTETSLGYMWIVSQLGLYSNSLYLKKKSVSKYVKEKNHSAFQDPTIHVLNICEQCRHLYQETQGEKNPLVMPLCPQIFLYRIFKTLIKMQLESWLKDTFKPLLNTYIMAKFIPQICLTLRDKANFAGWVLVRKS